MDLKLFKKVQIEMEDEQSEDMTNSLLNNKSQTKFFSDEDSENRS